MKIHYAIFTLEKGTYLALQLNCLSCVKKKNSIVSRFFKVLSLANYGPLKALAYIWLVPELMLYVIILLLLAQTFIDARCFNIFMGLKS
jgi:prepilin signal peptidase PulO-like enzyme (type II secretory pathway)